MATSLHSPFAEAADQPLSPQTSGKAADASGDTVLSRLPNGLTVLIKQDERFPLVSLRLYVHAGSAYEKAGQEGISHMLEHMVFKGTAKRPKGAVATDVEKTGGYLNAATSFDYTVYLTDMTAEHWKTGLDVLKDMAFHPSLDPEELEAEKDVVVAELKRGEDQPGQRLFRISQRASLQGSPYAHPIIGYEQSVRGLTSEGMRSYIESLYQPQSMLLVVCGKVSPDEVLAEAGKLFGDLRNQHAVSPPEKLKAVFAPKGFTAIVEKGPWKKAHLLLSLPVPGSGDLRSAQLDVLAQLLGGDASSRFYRNYKYSKRLVDSISVSNYSFERLGMFIIQAGLDEEKLPAFWEALSKDLAGLSALSFTKEELERAKLNIEDDLFRSKETISGYASKLGYFAFFADGERGEENYLRLVRDTDQKQLSELLAELFSPEKLSLAVLVPEKAEAPHLAKASGKEAVSDKTPSDAEAAWQNWFAATLSSAWKSPPLPKNKTRAVAGSSTPEVIDLGNNRTLILIPDATLPYTAANMSFSGGNSLLPEDDQGLAAFTASLLTKGTKKLSATAMEDFLSDRAASLSASAGQHAFSVSMNAPARFTDDMFELLQACLVTPAMKEEEAARVRDSQTAAIVAREDQPLGLAFRRLFPFLFEKHPYGYLQLGEKERVASFTAREAKAFWREQTLQPWVLSVCGVYDKERILQAVKKLPVPAKSANFVLPPPWGSEKALDLKLPGRNQAHLLMLFPTVGYGNKDEAGLELLENILSGQSGLLFRDLRDEQGLGYSVTAFSWKSAQAGALIFYIGTEPDKLTQAEEGFRKVIGQLHANPLPEAELERGKNQIAGDYYRSHQSLASRSSEAASLAILNRPLDAARKLVDDAGKVRAETLQQLARKYIQPDKAYWIKVLP